VTGVTTVVTGGYGPGAGAPTATRTDIGAEHRYDADHVISSMAFSSLVRALDPKPPAEVLAAADALKYRDFLTVALVLPVEAGFPDNWIYIHSPDVKVGRIQNFGSWSPFLVKDGRTCLGLEYFVNVGDETWKTSDEDLIALGAAELEKLGLAKAADVERGFVVRMPKAYPFYDAHYKENVETIRRWMEANTPNLHPVGRNGMFRYNNQDHSMLTAMLTVQNIVDGASHDIWEVNVEEDYHEEVSARRPEGEDVARATDAA
jgi:UDP-galactopyranose mutase